MVKVTGLEGKIKLAHKLIENKKKAELGDEDIRVVVPAPVANKGIFEAGLESVLSAATDEEMEAAQKAVEEAAKVSAARKAKRDEAAA